MKERRRITQGCVTSVFDVAVAPGGSFYMLAIGAGADNWLSALSVLFFVSIGNAPSVSCGL